jgi:hypothetical protein
MQEASEQRLLVRARHYATGESVDVVCGTTIVSIAPEPRSLRSSQRKETEVAAIFPPSPPFRGRGEEERS